MRNLNSYKNDCFEFYKSIVRSKRNSKNAPTYKSRLEKLDSEIENQFRGLDEKFSMNKLENLTALSLTEDECGILINLYSFKNPIIQKLKIEVTTDANDRIINTCQNCTINAINSFDHFMPKAEFAEFAVNPKNLFPSCTQCNSLKGTTWRESGRRRFLNLYLDDLPLKQYLFVDVKVVGDEITVNYFIDNSNRIDREMFTLIKNHYSKLDLLYRFKMDSDTVITEIENTVRVYIREIPINVIRKLIVDKCLEDRKSLGYNYWKSILQQTLINNDEFIRRLI